jgi:hypothetical protein
MTSGVDTDTLTFDGSPVDAGVPLERISGVAGVLFSDLSFLFSLLSFFFAFSLSLEAPFTLDAADDGLSFSI